jgi:YD repeat-containing protein
MPFGNGSYRRLTPTSSGGYDARLGYDARSNTTGKAGSASARATTATADARTGDPAQSNAYNGLDDRVSVTSGSVTHEFVYDPDGRLLGEYDASTGAPIAETIWASPSVANDNVPVGGEDGVGGYAPLAAVTGGGASAATYWVPVTSFDADKPAALSRSVVPCDTMSWRTPPAWPVISLKSLGPEHSAEASSSKRRLTP